MELIDFICPLHEISKPKLQDIAMSATDLAKLRAGKPVRHGEFPAANLIFDGAGNLYGSTFKGGLGQACAASNYDCGVVFELSPASGGSWTETVLYSFTGNGDGADPSGLVLDSSGNLYGTTEEEGTANFGNVFEVTP
jgi:uncharacterized repeat protein (TIGR03803 family)